MGRKQNWAIAGTGILLVIAGLYLLRATEEPTGFMKGLPYGLLGMGCGAFGWGISGIIQAAVLRKHPELSRQLEVEAQDERNVMLGNLAKSKGYDLMRGLFGVLIVIYALMGVSPFVVIPLVISYLFVQGYALYHRFQAEKRL